MTNIVNQVSAIIIGVVCVIVLLRPVSHAETNHGSVIVEVTGFKSSTGKVMIALCNSERDYDNDEKSYREAVLDVVDGRVIWNITDLPSGDYALKLYHDENNNNLMDTNLFGIPEEGIGFSNNARPGMGPPAFRDAKFRVEGSVVKQTILLNYM